MWTLRLVFVAISLPSIWSGNLIQLPEFWKSNKCKGPDNWALEKGPKPQPFGTYGDQLDPENDNYIYKNPVYERRVYYGVKNENKGEPWTGICNINEKSDRYQWCTCTILAPMFVITARLCFRDRPAVTPTTRNIPPINTLLLFLNS